MCTDYCGGLRRGGSTGECKRKGDAFPAQRGDPVSPGGPPAHKQLGGGLLMARCSEEPTTGQAGMLNLGRSRRGCGLCAEGICCGFHGRGTMMTPLSAQCLPPDGLSLAPPTVPGYSARRSLLRCAVLTGSRQAPESPQGGVLMDVA